MRIALANACDLRGLFSRFAEDQALLAMLSRLLPDMTFVPANLHDDKYRNLFSVEEVNRQVVVGVPFRDAYTAVARRGDFRAGPDAAARARWAFGEFAE